MQLRWDFSSVPVVKTPPSNAGGAGSIPGRGTKIPHAARCGQKYILKKSNCVSALRLTCDSKEKFVCLMGGPFKKIRLHHCHPKMEPEIGVLGQQNLPEPSRGWGKGRGRRQ